MIGSAVGESDREPTARISKKCGQMTVRGISGKSPDRQSKLGEGEQFDGGDEERGEPSLHLQARISYRM